MGTPDFAVEPLRRLVEAGKNIVAVIPCNINSRMKRYRSVHFTVSVARGDSPLI